MPVQPSDVLKATGPSWVLVTVEQKAKLDEQVRARATSVVGVIVCADSESYSGRWFSGRDWFLGELLEARGAIPREVNL